MLELSAVDASVDQNVEQNLIRLQNFALALFFTKRSAVQGKSVFIDRSFIYRFIFIYLGNSDFGLLGQFLLVGKFQVLEDLNGLQEVFLLAWLLYSLEQCAESEVVRVDFLNFHLIQELPGLAKLT